MESEKNKDAQTNNLLDAYGFDLKGFIDCLPDATFMVDINGKVVLWNKAMETMTGVSAAEMVGRGNYEYALPFYEERRPMLLDIVMNPELDMAERYYLFQKTDDMVSGETVVPVLRGRHRHLWGKAMLVRNKAGVVLGGIETIRDITDVKFSLERLLSQTAKCRQAFENIQDVYYEVAMDGTFFELSLSIKNVLGWQREELIGTSVTRLYANPADRDHFLKTITAAGGVDDYEILLRHRDGRPLSISINARFFPATDSEPPRIIGSMRNITLRKRIEEALRNSEERYRTLVENIPVAVIRTTPPPDGRFLMVNPAFLRMFGFADENEALLSSPDKTAYDPQERELFMKRVVESRRMEGTEMRLRRKDGETIWGAITAKAVYDEKSGRPLFLDCIIEDITERKKNDEEIRRLAYYDSLTSLANRTLFMDRLNMAILRAARENSCVVLMMFDLDLFKDVNDTMGHLVGDHLLKAVSRRLQSRLRKSDTIARLGGDEFMVIYSGVRDAGQAKMLAEKLLRVFDAPFGVAGKKVKITASVGIAVYPDDADDLDMLLRKVDIALYAAKEAGGNTSRRCEDTKESAETPGPTRERFASYLYFDKKKGKKEEGLD